MSRVSITLLIDALVNCALGILCLFHPFVAPELGIPAVENAFYPGILGAVLFGIGIALTIECFRKGRVMVGLGLAGAVAINLSGAVALILWLLFGDLALPFRGFVVLWLLAVLLVFISGYELYAGGRPESGRKGQGEKERPV